MKENRESGAILVMVAMMMTVLIGFGALSLDIGRLIVLDTEMQNAADSAAVAAAYELDGGGHARSHAKKAAKKLLNYTGHFGQTGNLLNHALPDSNIIFYCSINSADDPSPTPCTGSESSPGHYLATGDADAHYVKVSLDNNSSFTVDLMFLPVLQLLPGIGIVPTTASATAVSIAGRKLALAPLGVQLYE